VRVVDDRAIKQQGMAEGRRAKRADLQRGAAETGADHIQQGLYIAGSFIRRPGISLGLLNTKSSRDEPLGESERGLNQRRLQCARSASLTS